MPEEQGSFQMLWGCALSVMGILLLFRIPELMPRVEQIEYFSNAGFLVRISLYIVSILLIGGGGRKIYYYLKKGS